MTNQYYGHHDSQAKAHMAWCALVALFMAVKNGHVPDKKSENDYIYEWLLSALEEKRFCSSATKEIAWLIKQHCKLGNEANIRAKLFFLWNNGAGAIKEDAELLQLTLAVNSAVKDGWIYKLIEDHQWEQYINSLSKHSFDCLMVNRKSLDNAFDTKGRQKGNIDALIIGDISTLIKHLTGFGWYANATNGCCYTLKSKTVHPAILNIFN